MAIKPKTPSKLSTINPASDEHHVPSGVKIGAAIAGAAVLGAGILIGQRAVKINKGAKADPHNPLDRVAEPVSDAFDDLEKALGSVEKHAKKIAEHYKHK